MLLPQHAAAGMLCQVAHTQSAVTTQSHAGTSHRPLPRLPLQASFNWTGFLSAMGSNLTFQSRNVLSKKLMVKKVRGAEGAEGVEVGVCSWRRTVL